MQMKGVEECLPAYVLDKVHILCISIPDLNWWHAAKVQRAYYIDLDLGGIVSKLLLVISDGFTIADQT